MSLLQRIKSVLGLNGSPRREEDNPVAVTVEHEPTAEPDVAEPDPSDATAGEVDDIESVEEAEPASDMEEAESADVTEREAESPDASGATPASTAEDPTPTTEVSGIGPSYSERLQEAGVDSVSQLAEADAGAIADETGLSEKRVSGWIESARERVSGD